MNASIIASINATIKHLQPKFKYDADRVSRELTAALFPRIPQPDRVTHSERPVPDIIEVPVAPPPNLPKLTPTLEKKLKQVAEEVKAVANPNAFLAYVNNLTSAEFNARTPQEHMRIFLPPPPPDPEEEVNENCEGPVEFKGKVYYVGLTSKRVYEETEEGVHEFRGWFGVAEFKDMVMPEYDD
jgi:hypothetical protein